VAAVVCAEATLPNVTIPQTFTLAFQHHQAGRLWEAEGLYRQILAVQPNHAESLHHLGVIAHQTGRHDYAIELMRAALACDPNLHAAHSNLGEAYRMTGRLEEAIASYRRALQLQPEIAEIHNNLGLALASQGKLDEAVAAFRRALQIQPHYLKALSNLGNALRSLGQLDEAVTVYRRALDLQPNDAEVHSHLLHTLEYHPNQDERTIPEEQSRWNRQFSAPLQQFARPLTNDRNPERRLRVGYVSPDFREHVVGRNLVPLWEYHDHSQFEILCYSGVERPDDRTAAFRRRADQWRSTVSVADEALAAMIRQDSVDILVDLSQRTAGNRLPVFARRPAPVQVSFAGYPAAMGVEAMTYRISDPYLESEINEQVCLIDSFWCYDPCGVAIEVNELPAQENGRVTFGCLNSFCKINEPALRLWARVLHAVPGSRFMLLSPPGSARKHVLEILAREGVAADRVEFVEQCSRQAYLELYHRLDIALDPFPYNGHTTSLDALWMGVPVISLTGKRTVSRAAFSQLSNLGLPELIAFSEDEYVRLASQLPSDLPHLAELRRTLRPRMQASPLTDAPRFARSIETAYRTIWRQWCAGK
jgi:predicted O-linked N-acetylglucosamine transferase (SPINDLY family)